MLKILQMNSWVNKITKEKETKSMPNAVNEIIFINHYQSSIRECVIKSRWI
jgi:hypothetical protein